MVAAGYGQEALTLGPYNLADPMELEVSVLGKDKMEVLETLSEKTTSQALEISATRPWCLQQRFIHLLER